MSAPIWQYSTIPLIWHPLNQTDTGLSDSTHTGLSSYRYVVGSKSFWPDIQKPHEMENAVRDI